MNAFEIPVGDEQYNAICIVRDIGWYSNEYLEIPEGVVIHFTEGDIERLKRLVHIAETEKVEIRMNYEAGYLGGSPWSADVEQIIIHSASHMVYYSQDDDNSANQIESEPFSLAEIEAGGDEEPEEEGD
jgi:hypothetical protein